MRRQQSIKCQHLISTSKGGTTYKFFSSTLAPPLILEILVPPRSTKLLVEGEKLLNLTNSDTRTLSIREKKTNTKLRVELSQHSRQKIIVVITLGDYRFGSHILVLQFLKSTFYYVPLMKNLPSKMVT